MSTIAMKRSIEMNHTNVNEETGLIDRFKSMFWIVQIILQQVQ